jgi:DNA polymerase-3 subunit alpha
VEDALLIVQGKVQPDRFSGGLRLNVAQVWDLAEARARFGRYLAVDLNGRPATGGRTAAPVAAAQRWKANMGELRQGLLVRLRLHRQGKPRPNLDLGDDARFWPSDEALARWRSLAHGSARIVYD